MHCLPRVLGISNLMISFGDFWCYEPWVEILELQISECFVHYSDLNLLLLPWPYQRGSRGPAGLPPPPPPPQKKKKKERKKKKKEKKKKKKKKKEQKRKGERETHIKKKQSKTKQNKILNDSQMAKMKSTFLTCPCQGRSSRCKNSNYILKITIFVKMWNLGQFCILCDTYICDYLPHTTLLPNRFSVKCKFPFPILCFFLP